MREYNPILVQEIVNGHFLEGKKKTFHLALLFIFQFGIWVYQQDQPAAASLLQQGGARYKPHPRFCSTPGFHLWNQRISSSRHTCSRFSELGTTLLDQVSFFFSKQAKETKMAALKKTYKNILYTRLAIYSESKRRDTWSSDHSSASWYSVQTRQKVLTFSRM